MINIAVMGYGTVGSGVVEVINTNGARINQRIGDELNIKYVLDMKDFPGDPVQEKIVHDFETIVSDEDVQIVVEVMGGIEPAYTFVKRCLQAGKSVATSNKALVAKHGPELMEIAKEKNINFLFEASVGGGIPIIRPLKQCLEGNQIDEIMGIVNGTTNYILTKMFEDNMDFDEALAKAERLVADGGYGHTSSLYINVNEKEKMMKHAERMKTCRILVNTPSSHGGIGDLYNFKLAPSLTLGCGSWGGNSVSENVGVKHLLNIKTVAERRENMLWFRTPEKVYFKKGCLPVALNELKDVMGKKRAFIVTDSFLYKNGYTNVITDRLNEMGITYTVFSDVQPDPTLANAQAGAKLMKEFEPDVIIAMGGGSAMDAGKIMWVLYEHPEADFMDMAMRFIDIRKRVYTFPKMGEKAYFVAVPTSSGTGSEVTPFAVITDQETGIKYPLADYQLLPNMAIVDTDNMMSQPRGLTSASGVDVLTHALEAYASVMATDYTDGLALKAMKNVFDYLPIAYNEPNNVEARQKMADASCMAGMAFANAFLGVCHSMAHKLGAFHHLPHGIANALMISLVVEFNAAENPRKMGTFSQYQYPHTMARYAECARFCGINAGSDEEAVKKLIEKIEELKKAVGVKSCIKDYGIDEKDFLDRLDDMTEQAFDDQCTGANPRYPLMSEIKDMYLRAYYGK